MAQGGTTRFTKGQVPWNKGEHIEKTCPKCAGVFLVKPSLVRVVHCSRSCARRGEPSPMKGRTASAETRAKQRAAKLGIRGADHPNYRGGGSRTERQIAMGRDEYKQWRTAVFERDHYTCQVCGQAGNYLNADHILPWVSHPELRYEVSNGRTLCVPCHRKTPTFAWRAKHVIGATRSGKPIFAIAGGADNVAVTAGSGTTIGTDERTINSVAVQVQRVDEQAGTAVATGQVAPTNSAATLLAARDTRKTVTFVNQGTVNVYIGPATVTTGNGFLLVPGAGVDINTTALLQAITSSGTGAIHYVETYDA